MHSMRLDVLNPNLCFKLVNIQREVWEKIKTRFESIGANTRILTCPDFAQSQILGAELYMHGKGSFSSYINVINESKVYC